MRPAGLLHNSRTTPSPTLRELAAVLFRQSRSVWTVFAIVFLATLLYALFSPHYEAHLKVLLRRGRSDPVVSPQAAGQADFARPAISEEELNSEVELLRDEDLLKQVVVEATNTSVNPARSTATALFVGGWAVQQLWLFWLAPVVGAAIAGFVHTSVLESPVEEPPVTGRVASGVRV